MKKFKKARLRTRIILWPLYILPRPLKNFCAYSLAGFWYYVLRMRVKLSHSQVSRVFPELSDKEVSKIVFKSFYNLTLTLFEYSYFPFNPQRVVKHTEIRGEEEYFTPHVKSDKPIFLMTGHLANGEIILFRMGLEGHRYSLIGKRVGVKFIDSLLFEVRELSGLKHIPPKNGSKGILQAAKRKEPVVFVHDQFRHPPRGLKTTFLGLETYTNSSLAFFAQKTGAVVIPVNMFREKDKVVVEFHKEIPFEKKFSTEDENTLHMTQVYNDVLDKFIRQNPAGWMWVHKRWKKPNL